MASPHAGSYTFAFPRNAGEKDKIRYMLPLMDKMNHASPEAATARVGRDHSGAQFQVIAIQDIQKGEEVCDAHLPAHARLLPAPACTAQSTCLFWLIKADAAPMQTCCCQPGIQAMTCLNGNASHEYRRCINM